MIHDPLQGLVREVPLDRNDPDATVDREWLVTNGLGGYASASVAGLSTRKYHGVLVAALPNPLGRTVMLNHVAEALVGPGGHNLVLTGEEHAGADGIPGLAHLRAFRLEAGLPVWEFAANGVVVEKRVVMPHRQNTTYLLYRLLEGHGPVQLELRPAVHFRHYEHDVTRAAQPHYRVTLGDAYEISCDTIAAVLRLRVHGAERGFTQEERVLAEVRYRVEQARGYAAEGRLWSPGMFTVTLLPGQGAALVASTEPLDTMTALPPEEALTAEQERRRRLLLLVPEAARQRGAADLVLAADQFVITPAGRHRDAVRATAEGDEIRSVIAGYHWFTDWGRDTMISLEGLTLATGRVREARSILHTFGHYVRDGLIPNMFPDGSNEGLYHTADATLWFFHAVDRYVSATGDDALVQRLLPVLTGIAEHHLAGTRFGIHVDPADGLLHQGAEGYQLTWMDAKCDGWVVTPRRGKAVEINALWYNALTVLANLSERLHGGAAAAPWREHAARARRGFNARFWYERGGYLYDVVDGPQGDSIECRPNQVFAISLPNAVLEESRWTPVLRAIEARLATPVGLRSLAPGSEHYAPRYFGALRERDAAYHQGTVWAWLIGPWVDAWRKVHPDDTAGAMRWLEGLLAQLGEFGVGSVGEIFDAEPPYTPRGCIAQAWSVAEVLRQVIACRAPRVR